MTLFHIGNKFYDESDSIMSSIYTLKYKRYDWGKVQIALSQGKEVIIKPATKKQIKWAEKKLATLKNRDKILF